MEKQLINDMIPEQKKGIQSNTESDQEFASDQEAARFYEVVKKRLLNVNHWNRYAGEATAEFQLRDSQGRPVMRTVEKGDYFQIAIPGSGSDKEEGNDWVQVEAIEEADLPEGRFLAVRVRPAPDPLAKEEEIAHFFDNGSTSTFMVTLEHSKVTAGVYGRNEKPNTEKESFTDKVRDAVVALGAMAGFSKLQWKSLVTGLVDKEAVD